MITCFTKRTT